MSQIIKMDRPYVAWQSLFTQTWFKPSAKVPFSEFKSFHTKKSEVHYEDAQSMCTLLSEMGSPVIHFLESSNSHILKRKEGRKGGRE